MIKNLPEIMRIEESSSRQVLRYPIRFGNVNCMRKLRKRVQKFLYDFCVLQCPPSLVSTSPLFCMFLFNSESNSLAPLRNKAAGGNS